MLLSNFLWIYCLFIGMAIANLWNIYKIGCKFIAVDNVCPRQAQRAPLVRLCTCVIYVPAFSWHANGRAAWRYQKQQIMDVQNTNAI